MKETTKLKLDKWMLGLLAMALLAVICFKSTPTHAQNASSRQPSALIVQLAGTYHPPLNQPAPNGRAQVGMELQWSSPSANATVLPNGTSAGDTYAYYIGQGYSFQTLPGDRVLFFKEK